MKAVILVGGEGTRLRPLTLTVPKNIVPVVNRPLIHYIFSWLKKHGVSEVILVACYLPDKLKKVLGNSTFGIKVKYIYEDTPLGTGGAIKRAEKYMDGTTIVMNGDILTDIDITKMLKFHRAKKSDMTIALTPVQDPTHYGVVDTDSGDRIIRFLEKPSIDEVPGGRAFINAGVYLMEPGVLKLMQTGKKYSIERDVFPLLAGKSAYGFKPGKIYWIDIGTPDRYMQVTRDILDGQCKIDMEQPAGRGVKKGSGVKVLKPSVIGDKTLIGDKAVIGEFTVIGNGCNIGKGSLLEGCVLWDGVKIGDDCVIKDCVIGEGSNIGHNSEILGDIILGANYYPFFQVKNTMKRYYYYLAFFAVFIVYVMTLAPSITATGDSSEVIVSSYVTGVPHPPGYPLFSMIGKLFVFLPVSTVAFRINAMCALLSLLSLIFFYLVMRKITGDEPASAIATVIVAFIPIFWEYSIVSEVFSLHNLFVMAIIYVLLIWKDEYREKWLYLFCFLLGLSLTHHQIMLFLFPAFLVFFIYNWRGINFKHLPVYIGLFFVGLLPYFYLPYAAALKPPLNWDNPVINWSKPFDPESYSAFINMIMRSDYAKPTFIFEHYKDVKEGQFWLYWYSLIRNFTPLGFILGIVGLFYMKRKDKQVFYFFLTAFVFGSLVFVGLLGKTSDKVVLHVLQRLYIFTFMIFAVFIGFCISGFLKDKILKIILACLVVINTGMNYHRLDKSDNYLLLDFCSNMIRFSPDNSILIVSGDTLSMGIDYLKMVEKAKPKSEVLDQEKMTYPWYCDQKKEAGVNIPFYLYNGMTSTLKDLVDENYRTHKIYVTGPKERSIDNDYFMLGQGMLRIVLRKYEQVDIHKLKMENDEIWRKFVMRKTDLKLYDHSSFEWEIVTIYAKARFNQGFAYDSYGQFDYAIKEYEESMKIYPEFASTYKNIGIVYYNVYKRYELAGKMWEKYLELNPKDEEAKMIRGEVEKIKAGQAGKPPPFRRLQ